VLLIVPAFALDLLWQRTRSWKLWQIAIVSGILFVAIVFGVEWPFAKFLLSKASENRFFGTAYFDYNTQATGFERMRRFFHPDHGLTLIKGLAIATLCAIASTWVGLRFGRWMRGVQR
jgi:type IV secretory pathway TrbD component